MIQLSTNAQSGNGMFSKDPIINIENFQKQRVYFGFFLGFNNYDFKINYKTVIPSPETYYIQVKKSTGFNVGLVTDLRLQEYVNLRFEPGLYYTKRDLFYPDIPTTNSSNITEYNTPSGKIREVNSTYLHFPLLLKFSSLRTGNVRPYIMGGFSATLNLSSNAKSKDDNLANTFRVKPWTTNYELGLGIDVFSEYFIFSPSIRAVFGINDELIRDNSATSPWTSNIESIKSRAIFINFTFH